MSAYAIDVQITLIWQGHRVGPSTRGKLQVAPTSATTIRLIGKEGRRWRDTRNILPGPDVTTFANVTDRQVTLERIRSHYEWRGAAPELARLSGLPVRTIRAFLGGRNPSEETCERLLGLGAAR